MKTRIDRWKSGLEKNLQSRMGSPVKWGLKCIHGADRGFSLVEVVLAIGLTTFALLVMFSLMPVGLNTLQDANRQIVEAEIFNIIGAELTTTRYELLEDYAKSADHFPAYFDMDGLRVSPTSSQVVFTVKCVVLDDKLDESRRAVVFIGYRIKEDKLQDLINQKQYNSPAAKCRSFLLSNRGI